MYFFYKAPALNQDAERRHIGPASFLFIGTIVLHLISGSTEIFSFYNIALSELSKYLPPTLAYAVSWLFGFIVSFVIELGIYVFLAAVAGAIVHGYFKGPEKSLYLLYSAALALFAGAGLFGSFAGSEYIAQSISTANRSPAINSDSIAIKYTTKNDSTRLYFDHRATQISTTAQHHRQTAKALYKPLKLPYDQERARLMTIRTKDNYQYIDKKVNKALTVAARIDKQLAERIKEIDTNEAVQLAAIAQDRKQERDQLMTDKAAALASANNHNAKAAIQAKQVFDSTNARLYWIVLFAFIGQFILAWTTAKRHLICEIESTPVFSASHGRSYFTELLYTRIERIENRLFAALDKYRNNTQAYIPAAPRSQPRRDYSPVINQPVKQVRYLEADDDPTEPIYIPRPAAAGSVRPVRTVGFNQVSRPAAVGANGPVITAPIESNKNGKAITADDNRRACLHCGTPYIYKAWNQKYCTTTCKDQYHTAKHNGKVFEPMKYKRKR